MHMHTQNLVVCKNKKKSHGKSCPGPGTLLNPPLLVGFCIFFFKILLRIKINSLALVYYTIMDFLLSKYGLIFTELTVLTEAEPRSILSNSVNIRPYLLSKMPITVLLYSETIYEL